MPRGLGVFYDASISTSTAIQWLLASSEPAVRLLARLDLLGERIANTDEVLDGPKVRALLAGQRPDGGFGGAAHEKSSSAFIGWFHFRPPPGHAPDDVELGYRLRRSAWGKGYATEGSRALIARGFTELGVERVFASTMAINVASRRVMEKAGLKFVGIVHTEWPIRIEGDEHGDAEYALTREEFLAVGVADINPWQRTLGVVDPPSYLDPTQAAGRALLQRGITGPLVMLNLLRFRAIADYSQAPELAPDRPISGAEAFDRYIAHTLPYLHASGGELVFLGDGGLLLIGPEANGGTWSCWCASAAWSRSCGSPTTRRTRWASGTEPRR